MIKGDFILFIADVKRIRRVFILMILCRFIIIYDVNKR